MTAVVPQMGPGSFQAMKPAEIHPAIKEIALDPAQFRQLLSESCIEFSDGSRWQLASVPTSWEANDGYVIVAPEANSEKYRIFNLKALTHVEASLKMAPILDRNPLAIFEIDFLEKTMELTDGLRFQIDGEIQEWNENDVVVLGMQHGPTEKSQDGAVILINCQLGNFVQATMLNGHNTLPLMPGH